MSVKVLVIGDTHFKHGAFIQDCEEYIVKVVAIAKKQKPNFIVLLGDTLDRHGIVYVQAHKLVERFLEELSSVAHTYVIMGNHDYINNSQFLTDNHIYGPFKKWENVTIVDKVVCIDINERYFVFVPYVPPGKFVDALDTLIKDGETWELADCIFAHQEFRGCKPRVNDNYTSQIGDVWDEDYPLIISGHIHKSQDVGTNIKYPGNSLQHSYLENPDKRVWIVKWNEDMEIAEPDIKKLRTGMKIKESMVFTIDEIKSKEEDYFEKYDSNLNIKLIGTSAEFTNFKSSKLCTNLTSKGITFSYELDNLSDQTSLPTLNLDPTNSTISTDSDKKTHKSRKNMCYDRVFQNLVSCKNDLIRREYEEIFGKLESMESFESEGESKEYIEITFAGSTDS